MQHLFTPAGEAALVATLQRRPLLAFDFDGTLAPIVARPDDARISQAVGQRLRALAAQLPVAIISGRLVADVRERLSFEAPYVIGKPEVHSTMIALNKLGVNPESVLMVGDRIDTDIEAGRRCGLNVALVLTGDTYDPGEVDFPVHRDLSSLVDQILM